MTISVVIPTREHVNPATGRPYFERAVASAEAQVGDFQVNATVGVDRSPAPIGQAKIVNEVVARCDGDFLAFLEDDDTWDPNKLSVQLPLLEHFDLVTCNQREVNERGAFLSYSYYPTPSGWLMRRSTWDLVGGLDERLRFHVDTDWLGRANQVGLRRVHIVQATADTKIGNWTTNMTASSIVVGPLPEPLVTRTIRDGSITGRIKRDREFRIRSDLDYQTIRRRFGGSLPW